MNPNQQLGIDQAADVIRYSCYGILCGVLPFLSGSVVEAHVAPISRTRVAVTTRLRTPDGTLRYSDGRVLRADVVGTHQTHTDLSFSAVTRTAINAAERLLTAIEDRHRETVTYEQHIEELADDDVNDAAETGGDSTPKRRGRKRRAQE